MGRSRATRRYNCGISYKGIFENWICRFGCPENVHTDRGRQFYSKLFKDVVKLVGAQLKQTTSFHPQSNGLVERFHRTLKASLIAHDNQQWTKTLPIVLLGLRTVLKEDINASPAELVYGETLRLPGDFFKESKKRKIYLSSYQV